jgi:hypothetical protein
MDSDERNIFQYLKTWGAEFVNSKEISRRAGSKQKYHEDPDWAKIVLMRMQDRGIVECDINGRYRVKPVKKDKHKRWVSPEISKILGEQGVESGEGGEGLGSDEHYDGL